MEEQAHKEGRYYCDACRVTFVNEHDFRSHLRHRMMTEQVIQYDVDYQNRQIEQWKKTNTT